jgi:hypothetical protein
MRRRDGRRKIALGHGLQRANGAFVVRERAPDCVGAEAKDAALCDGRCDTFGEHPLKTRVVQSDDARARFENGLGIVQLCERKLLRKPEGHAPRLTGLHDRDVSFVVDG